MKMTVRIYPTKVTAASLFAFLALTFCSDGAVGFSPCAKSTRRTKHGTYQTTGISNLFSQTTITLSNGNTALSLGSNANEINPIKAGCTVALITPFTPTGQIDFPSLRRLLQFHVEAQTDGLCILGTTGEASLMSMDERKSVLDVAVEEVKGKIPILVGTGAINPSDVTAMTLQAIDCGCDASLVVTPPYIKPPPRGLIRHFTTMADLGLPLVIYNVPGRTSLDVLPATIAACAREHPGIVGVKEATGDTSRVAQIRTLTEDLPTPLLLYSGDDSTQAEFVLGGGDGCISVTANVAPARMHQMIMAAVAGDKEEALRIDAGLQDLHRDIFCEANPIPAKWALKRIGMVDSAYCRPPLMELDQEYHNLVETALKTSGLL